jgi:hypothetical protein
MSTTQSWYPKPGSGGQGIVIDEADGRTVAVAYDHKDTALLAASPKLLAALNRTVARLEFVTRHSHFTTADDRTISQARAAIAEAETSQQQAKLLLDAK